MKLAIEQLATLCACGHERKWHAGREKDQDCVASIEGTFQFCSCKRFHEYQFKNEQEIMMAKEKKSKKSEGRKPALESFVDSSFKIYLNHGGKEYEATVLSSGLIRYNDKDYTSPSSVGKKIVGVAINGWRAWKFNKDGERVELNVLRGSKSPLKATEAKSKKAATPKAKKARKPRTKKVKPVAEQGETTSSESQAAA